MCFRNVSRAFSRKNAHCATTDRKRLHRAHMWRPRGQRPAVAGTHQAVRPISAAAMWFHAGGGRRQRCLAGRDTTPIKVYDHGDDGLTGPAPRHSGRPRSDEAAQRGQGRRRSPRRTGAGNLSSARRQAVSEARALRSWGVTTAADRAPPLDGMPPRPRCRIPQWHHGGSRSARRDRGGAWRSGIRGDGRRR